MLRFVGDFDFLLLKFNEFIDVLIFIGFILCVCDCDCGVFIADYGYDY